jgi:hypothetical protein
MGSKRFWVVERDANGDCTDDYISESTHAKALKLAQSLAKHPTQSDTTSVELGCIVGFETAHQEEHVLKVWTIK